MDQIDIRIVDALQEDASLTQAQLADRVHSTPSTCLRRVKALVRRGVLKKSVFLADPVKLERRLKAVISIVTKGHGDKQLNSLISRLQMNPAINAVYSTTGEVDLFAIGHFSDMEDFHDKCEQTLGNDPYVERYTTFFVVTTHKETTSISTDLLGPV